MFPARTSDAPSLRLSPPDHTVRVLRTHFFRHNRRVLLLAVGTLFTTAALWLILYGVCCWLILLAFAAADHAHLGIPRGFGILFTVGALCAVIYAWIDRRLTPDESPRDDKRAGEIVADFLLAIPRMSLAIGGTLAAWQRLSTTDLAQATELLHRLAKARRLPMSAVRLEIPDPAAATRILFALQITQIIDAHREGQEFWLRLNPLRPPALRLTRGSYADA
jgi:hypothetical protein